jgi:CheY-like chemotaxis protein
MRGRAVLFIDDEPTILQVRRLIFEASGYFVFTAESGKEALRVLEHEYIDVIVLDYLMPEMNGEETARAIRKSLLDIPIILSSGCLEIPKSTLSFVNAHVHKGEPPEVLIEVIRQWSERRIGKWENRIGMSAD